MYNTLVFVILCTYIVGMDMYEVKEIVGKGAFAKVYSATCMMSSCNTDILDFDYLDSADLESKLIALKVSHSEQVFVKVSLRTGSSKGKSFRTGICKGKSVRTGSSEGKSVRTGTEVWVTYIHIYNFL